MFPKMSVSCRTRLYGNYGITAHAQNTFSIASIASIAFILWKTVTSMIVRCDGVLWMAERNTLCMSCSERDRISCLQQFHKTFQLSTTLLISAWEWKSRRHHTHRAWGFSTCYSGNWYSLVSFTLNRDELGGGKASNQQELLSDSDWKARFTGSRVQSWMWKRNFRERAVWQR